MSTDFSALQREFLEILPFGQQLLKKSVADKCSKIKNFDKKTYTSNSSGKFWILYNYVVTSYKLSSRFEIWDLEY